MRSRRRTNERNHNSNIKTTSSNARSSNGLQTKYEYAKRHINIIFFSLLSTTKEIERDECSNIQWLTYTHGQTHTHDLALAQWHMDTRAYIYICICCGHMGVRVCMRMTVYFGRRVKYFYFNYSNATAPSYFIERIRFVMSSSSTFTHSVRFCFSSFCSP